MQSHPLNCVYILSRYLRVRAKNDYLAIFHDLHADPVYCLKTEWEIFTESISEHANSDLFGKLKQRKLIVQSSQEDDEELKYVSVRLEHKLNQPTILYLMMAQGCNFACKYCPIPHIAEEYGENMLSFEDAVAGVNLWAEHLREMFNPSLQYFIIFYGGEPLLNKEVIRKTLTHVENLRKNGSLPDKNINFMIATNGVLFDEQMIELCKKYGVLVAIGLDGPTADCNTLRLSVDGESTYDATVKTIKLLIQNGIRVFASVSVTPWNIDRVGDCFDFFRKLGVEKIGFNFLKGRFLFDSVAPSEVENYFLKVTREIIKRSMAKENQRFEYQTEKKVAAFENRDFFPVDCTCYGNQLVIQPDGQVSNCPFFRAQLGNIKELGHGFRIWNTGIVKEWRKRLPLYHSEFRDVDSKSLCGAGCAWSCYELTGNFFAVDTASKIFTEEVFNELIWSRFNVQA